MHEVGQERCLPPPPAASLAKLVMQVQRLQRLALYAAATTAVMLTLNYLLLDLADLPAARPEQLQGSTVPAFAGLQETEGIAVQTTGALQRAFQRVLGRTPG